MDEDLSYCGNVRQGVYVISSEGKLAVDIVVDEGAVLPQYQTSGSSGMDIHSMTDCILLPHDRILVKTGLKVAIPEGFEIQIRPRSGMALKHGITVLNTPGTIDSDYRNEIGVILFNTSDTPFNICKGDRIAQMVLCPIAIIPRWNVVKELNTTERNLGGFGHTGK